MNRILFNGTSLNGHAFIRGLAEAGVGVEAKLNIAYGFGIIGEAPIVVEVDGDIVAATYEEGLEGQAAIAVQSSGELSVADAVWASGSEAMIRLMAHSGVICNGDFCFDVSVKIGGQAESWFYSRGELITWTRVMLEGSAGIGVEMKAERYGRPAIPSDYAPAHPEWSFRMDREDWRFDVPRDDWGQA